jgi:formate dehydrogenase alpha subunit
VKGAPFGQTIDRWERSYCPYCGVGCGLLVGLKGNTLIKVNGDPEHPANFGEICAKAVFLHRTIATRDRLLYPQMRSRRDAPLVRVSWEQALKRAAARFRETITRHGPDAVAFYGSGQLTTEDYYVYNKLAKGFLGTNNFDTNSRLCMASAVAGYRTSLGSDGPPASYADLDVADCFLLIGTNTAECHPIVFRRIERRKRSDPDRVTVIVVDPRRTETADLADLHLAIRPGSDVALINAMLHVIVKEGLLDRDFIERHTKDWEALASTIERYTPQYGQEICGIRPSLIVQAARTFATSQRSLILWSMGINQSTIGVTKNNALINLSLATGQIGRPGAGPFSLTGQPNAMGGREVGGLSHLLPGYRSVTSADDRAEIAGIWGVPAAHLSPKPGYPAIEIFEALASGTVKAVWILCTNPMVSMPEPDTVEKALRQAELVVVQDAYHPTDTTQYADILLPAAQWPEKEGAMTNSERRITYMPKLIDPPGEALPDWEIGARFARQLGFGAAFPYRSAREIFDECARSTKGRFNDYSGVSYARLKQGPLQWPCPTADHPGTERLYVDRHFQTEDGRGRFIPAEHREPYERTDRDYPLTLTTGRLKNQWHTMTKTGKIESLLKSGRDPFVEIHPQDAAKIAIQDGDFVEVTSRRGKAIAQARVTEEILRGTCFMPFHWGRAAGYYKAANNLTVKARDPMSRQPELKACAVRITKVEDLPMEHDGSIRDSPAEAAQ